MVSSSESAGSSSAPRALSRRLSGWLAESPFLAPGKSLMEQNWQNYYLPLSKWGKLAAGSYLILKDYSEGRFPPTFTDQARAYQAEIDYCVSLPGAEKARLLHDATVKPFWGAAGFEKYTDEMKQLFRTFELLGLLPGARVLELGCGSGWMTEFLALTGYRVMGTTLAPDDVEIGRRRTAALVARGLPAENLQFQIAPMETVDVAVGAGPVFDAVFVFEALHHAFDWRRAIQASARCLRPGGWLLLANEPNLLHTFISHRVARLANTHEIGMSRRELVAELRLAGLNEVRILAPRFNDLVSKHWIAARQ